jgi:2'-5' RNA ligase
MRAFIAIDIPSEIKDRIGELINECKDIKYSQVKYVEIENLHITLKFLGEIEKDTLGPLLDDFSKISPPVTALSIFSAGAFPGMDLPKVAWVGIRENTSFSKAFEEIENVAQKYGFIPEERDFHPHITIARIKGRVVNEWVKVIKKYSSFEFGNFVPDGFSIYKSDLNKFGPVYTRLAFFPFKEDPHGK